MTGFHRFDVLVVGAGGAGLRAAVAAAQQGARVAVVSKSLLGKSQTVMGAALAAVLGTGAPGDAWSQHFADTVRGARHVNQWRMAQLLAQEAPARVREMEAWGAVFDRAANGLIKLGDGSGHAKPRLARAGHRTGLELVRALQGQLSALGVEVFAEHAVVELLKQGDAVVGACGLRRATGEAVWFRAGAVVLATGGIGKAYEITSNFYDATGDGQALASRAGAELIDMEFVQFHPTGMVAPASARGLLVAESIRNFGGVFRNALGERFMFRYVPPGYRAEIAEDEAEADRWFIDPKGARRPPELLPRDDISRAIESEIRAGRGTANGGVIMDIASRRPPEFIRRALPHMVEQFMELARLDITREPMEVAPTCHYTMGGIRVDPDTTASSLRGLFAAGECAGGLHGANRLNGNGISELLVFGRRAGEAAAAHATAAGAALDIDEAALRRQAEAADRHVRMLIAPGDAGEDPYAIQQAIQQLMQRSAGLVRSEDGLNAALAELAALRGRASRIRAAGGAAANPAWQCALDVRSLLEVAEAVLRSALLRRETRGAHVRDDHPDFDARLGAQNIVVHRTPDGQHAVPVDRAPAPEELQSCIDAAERQA